jgi:hypothetical protein
MPEKATRRRAAAARRRGDKPSTQAGAFVREEMHHKAKARCIASPALGRRRASEDLVRFRTWQFASPVTN